MGVTGLWRLIEPAGKPVPVENLENKVLSVDISIWLHQMVKGYQDAKGAPLPNAHLIGLFQRLCKLLYFRIKPVFVFDGAFPALKRETIAKRQDNKQKYNSESERIKRELAILLTKKTAIGSLLGKHLSPTKKASKPTAQTEEDIFKLPALPAIPQNDEESESEDETSSSSSIVDLHSIDLESQNFKALPAKEKYDLLLDLKETRKMNSWGKLHELPKKSDNFSDFQLQRLLKRRKVQECLQETEKEIGDTGMSLNELESLLNEEGIDTKIETLPTKRIASNNSTRYLLINDVKQALADAKKKKEAENQASSSKVEETTNIEGNETKKDELEDDLEKAIKMSLECTSAADTTAGTSKTDDSWTSYMTDSETELSKTDSEEEDGCEAPDMTSAKAYIMQYCDFTNKAIDDIIARNKTAKSKNKKSQIDEILNDIGLKKSQMVENCDHLSSSDNEGADTSDSDVVEVQTIATHDSKTEGVDVTEASVVVLENLSEEDVVTLDSTIENSPKQSYETKNNVDNQMEYSADFEDDPQLLQALATSTSLQSSDKNEESDISSDDFEDVPEIDSKPVVQLTLNVNETLEDDIFADVFTVNQGNDSIQDKINVIPNFIDKNRQITNEIVPEEDDDELQKAIMMSLECVTHEKSTVSYESKGADIETENFVSKTNDEPNTDSSKIENPTASKTQESLNEILSTPSPKANEVMKKVAKETPRTSKDKTPISNEQLNNMVEEIQNEEQSLEHEKGRLDRIGRNITEQMTKEAQELLQIFGIPYIVAPMEAEAQCAFLESVNLTDGTITDDSDIWLFGGRTVYKNFFNQKKHVLQFLGERIEKSFNLNRDQLVLLALLVGSDYTTGIDGVGPVTALEILASFPFNKRKLSEATEQTRYTEMTTGLQKFKDWVRSGKRTDNTTLKKKLRNISLNDDFPSVRVVQAYLEPNIEKSKEKFSWGELDIAILRDYTKAKFGWSQHKLDEIIKPVLKRMVERKTQKSMQDYFKIKTGFESLENQMSKRVKAAVQRIGPETGIVGEENVESENPAVKRKNNKGKNSLAGPSKSKKKRTDDNVLNNLSVKVVSEVKGGKSEIDIKIHKTDRVQEIIPQREKDKQSLFQNKMKAIELFRKTNIDKKKKLMKRKAILPKEKANLSESSDSN